MIVVNMAMKQDDVIAILEANGYKFVEKKGIRLFFEVAGDLAAKATEAKTLIKAQPWGMALYFNVEVVK
ncbi:hypothetical protein [Pseudolactococcus reticulitermitis]|uniref:Uncharacterized protein n=1 Tax=Pseudolactococcus reticulitermitis TaxID=2025039 RepID=A0A224X1L0_9LACT|nr:hypothetical protein [Lactococcus reticulitermitis]GAX48068.1 hypothetical protein RsY01_1682 [Lactococcus reticulitermitis]GHU37064.1 hypothetical protein FACS1894192_05070 [Bacilli bacterium]GHU39980.1 hypothetical protein FACS1894193_01490 [Bacilli bacterium]